MRTFENFRKVVNESDYILSEAQRYLEILLEKDSEALKQYKKSQKSFQKGFGKNIKPTVVQPSLDLYKAGGPFIPDKTTFKNTGKKVPKMEPKPRFSQQQKLPLNLKPGAPDRSLVKQAISDIRASDRRLYDTGAKPKTSFSRPQQKKIELDIIKKNLSQQRRRQQAYDAFDSSDVGRPDTSSKTVTPTKPQKSASATDYTKKINQANKNRKEFTGNKKSFQAFKKQADAASDKLVAKREVVRSNTGKKDVQKLKDINKQIKSTERISKGYDLASKGKGNLKSPIVKSSDLKQVTDNTAKVTFNPSKPQKGKELPVAKSGSKSKGSKIPNYVMKKSKKFGIKPENILTTRQKKDLLSKRTKQARTITKKMGGQGTVDFLRKVKKTGIGKKIYSKPAGKLALKSTAGIVKAASKNPYTAAAAVVGAGLLTQPNVRKGIKAALAGGGIGALTGAFAKDNRQNKSAEYGKKTYIKKGSISLSPPAPKETNYSKTMSSVKPYDFTKINKKIKADQTAKNNASYAKKNALSASEKQKQRRGIG